MRETWGLFLMLVGTAFLWVGIHGYSGSGIPGVLDTIYGAVSNA